MKVDVFKKEQVELANDNFGGMPMNLSSNH